MLLYSHRRCGKSSLILKRFRELKAEVGIGNPAALLATYMMDREGLKQFAGEADPVTDNRPRIEYAPWVRPGEFTRILPRLLELAVPVPLSNASQQLRDEIQAEQQTLFDFYRGTLVGYADRKAWGMYMKRVFSRDGNNPYYGWFIGR